MSFMARFVSFSLRLTTTNLRRIAVSLKAGVKPTSNYRRIRRSLAGYDLDYSVLSTLLIRLLPQQPPYMLVTGRTEWPFGEWHFGQTPVNVLMIGIAHRGIAFPIAWTAFPIAWTALPKSGGSGPKEQIGDRHGGSGPLGAAVRDESQGPYLTTDKAGLWVVLRGAQVTNVPC
jgi:hypothetical protein